ncbi:multidrug resistance-associated protein 4-like isoform X2 [Actinia tenebrosa]|uniref:Multidrug resistance-associated protein 4-like isoform X2 n=1 Tax=Actinia tenebrosa TaxID=6105 RepID=A0A6P8H6L6_ACTTE|nr:multidrug resistance-associated protein 4-like isoform X2 [Actinia tenebrosa]
MASVEHHGDHHQPRKSARQKAFCLSKYLTFWWLNPLLSRGFKKSLQESDLNELVSLHGLGIEETTSQLQQHWNNEHKNIKKKPSLFRAVVKTLGTRYALLMIFAIIIDGLGITQAYFLKKLIKYFSVGTKVTEKDAYIYALVVSLCSIGSLFFNTPYYYHRKITGLLAKEGCITLIYDKILKLDPTTCNKIQNQNINIGSLITSDAAKIESAFFYLHYLILGPVEVLVVLYLLWEEIGVSSLAGMGLLLLLVPLQVKMSSFIMYLRREALHAIDARTKVMREIISGIRVVKMYTSEDLLRQLIGDLRRKEITWFKRLSIGKSLFTSLFFSSPALISFLTFMTYVLVTDNNLNASKVFMCVALFSSIRVVMTMMFPAAVAAIVELRVSLERVQDVLMLEELCPSCRGLISSQEKPNPGEYSISGENITASWTNDFNRPTLRNISFSVGQNQMLAVIGEVGSGKTSFLQAIIGELPFKEGSMKVNGRIGYASQQAWVYNGSVRENIIFGKDYDEKRFKEVIKACALERDLKLFAEGDMTLVGERGTSLSGGQRARIGLARAVYSDADIFLLDDPLSAVDIHVGNQLYKRCIRGYLSSKARILVTHQFRYIKEADHIIALSEGEIVARGSFTDIRMSGIDLISMCPLKKSIEEEEELQEIAETVTPKPELRHRRHSNASTSSSKFMDLIRPQAQLSHHVTEILEENEGETGAFQVPVYEEEIKPKEETKHEGAVSIATYVSYFKSLHNACAAIFVLFLFVLAQVLSMLADWWLSYWSDIEEKYFITSSKPDRSLYLGVFAGFSFGLLIVTLARTLIFYTLCLIASCHLHNRMFSALIRAPVYFFDNNSLGRILNRFSKDINYVDESLPTTLMDFFQTAFMTMGVIFLVGSKSPICFAIVLPILIFFVIERMYYIRTARDLKRLDGVTRSPLYGHFSTTLLGLDTIRAFGAKDAFFHEFHHYLEVNTRSIFGYISVSSWLTFRLELLSVIFVSFVALISPAVKSSLSPGAVGLIVTYATKLSSVLAKTIKKSTEVENMMTSVERIVDYCNLESEAPMETDVKPPKGWPDKGAINITHMNYSHHKDKPVVLHDITLQIKPEEKLGVLGRSGAGKSSFISSLFRMAEPSGLIEIDGVDISKIGLRNLRNAITIIPQEPVLFSSTLRKNLDITLSKEDVYIWSVLEQVQLKDYVERFPNKLETKINGFGLQFSVGQRQLICLARAILCHTKILVIDEATANVDSRTSKIIWDVINCRFKDCTVITIAHRLFPVMQNDRVVINTSRSRRKKTLGFCRLNEKQTRKNKSVAAFHATYAGTTHA